MLSVCYALRHPIEKVLTMLRLLKASLLQKNLILDLRSLVLRLYICPAKLETMNRQWLSSMAQVSLGERSVELVSVLECTDSTTRYILVVFTLLRMGNQSRQVSLGCSMKWLFRV